MYSGQRRSQTLPFRIAKSCHSLAIYDCKTTLFGCLLPFHSPLKFSGDKLLGHASIDIPLHLRMQAHIHSAKLL